MNGKSDKSPPPIDIETIAEQAERGRRCLCLLYHQHVAKQWVNVDFPLALLRQIIQNASARASHARRGLGWSVQSGSGNASANRRLSWHVA